MALLLAPAVVLCGPLLGGCVSSGGPDRIDLGPRDGWHAAGLARVRDDGRVSLTGDGRGFVWKAVTFDVDRYPVLLVRTAQSLPRFGWTVAVRRGDQSPGDESGAITLLTKVAEEGGYVVPLSLPTGWRGTVQFILLIALEGRARDWIEFGDIQAVRLSSAKPPPPRLAEPANASTISPLALHYSWHQATNALSYDLQVSATRSFSQPTTIHVTAPYLADRLPYLPEPGELLPAGTWFLRVRGINLTGDVGEWSTEQSFNVREAPAQPKPPDVSVSARHPLIVLVGDGRHLAENWRVVPTALKPYTVLRIEALPAETLEAVVRAAQRDTVPVVVQVSGPHDYYGPVASRIPLPVVERLLQYSVVKGVYLCEQAFRVSPANDRIMRQYAGRLILLAAEYGKLVLWADGHWGRNLFIDVGLDQELLHTIRAYRAYVIPIWKMNGALTPYSAHDAAFGLWVSGAVDNWGVQPESWYWYEAGFRKLNQQFWFKEGEIADFPPSFYAQMALLGLSSGASVYSFEPGGDVFDIGGGLSEIARQVTFPLLSQIIERDLIQDRNQLLPHIRSVYVTTDEDGRWSLDYGTLAPLYSAAYGIRHPFQIIPANSRYFWIPLLPPGTPPAVLARFPDRLHAGEFPSAAEARRHLDRVHPPRDSPEAWTAELAGGAVVLHARENEDVDQRFSMTLEGGVSRITGHVGVNGYLVAQGDPATFWMQVNGPVGRQQEVTLWMRRRPREVTASRPDALRSVNWEPSRGQCVIVLRLDGSAVDVRVTI